MSARRSRDPPATGWADPRLGASSGQDTRSPYVGPWTPREGEFWNAPFGAVRTAEQLPDADAVAVFFAAGRAAAG